MTRREKHLLQLTGYAVLSAAVLITAWKGTLEWPLAAAVAIAFGLPGIKPALKLIKEWRGNDCRPD